MHIMIQKCRKMDGVAYKCVIKGTLWCIFVLFSTYYVVADLADGRFVLSVIKKGAAHISELSFLSLLIHTHLRF